MRRRIGGAAAILFVVVVAVAVWSNGCASGSHTTSGSLLRDAGERYLAAARIVNGNVRVAKAALARDHADPDKVKQDLGAIAAAKERFDDVLRTLVVPDSAKADLASLIAADAELIRTLKLAQASTSVAQLQARQPAAIQAGVAEVAAANSVRSDLGLPPVP